MKLVTYVYEGKERVGIVSDDGTKVFATKFDTMNDLILSGTEPGSGIAAADGKAVDIGSVKLLAPIPYPRQDVLCVGINYRDHQEEITGLFQDNAPATDTRTVFLDKRVNRAVDPGGAIEAHEDLDTALDYEVELAVVIGRDARYVKAEDAYDFIFGYTIINEVSARTRQMEHSQYFFGKSFDDFTPMGPWIVTEDEIERPPERIVRSYVNGELRQNSSTSMMIRNVGQIIEELSQGITLKAGTIIATGTPSGVGTGFDPPKCMKPGDVVVCEIEGIGTLENHVVSSAEKWGR